MLHQVQVYKVTVVLVSSGTPFSIGPANLTCSSLTSLYTSLLLTSINFNSFVY
jgi:hypothetical protein